MSKKYQSSDGRIYLRALQPEDVSDEYISWFKNSVVTEFLDAKGITKQDAIDYIVKGRETRTHFMYGIFDTENDIHIGNVKIGPIMWEHLTSDLVTVIGNRDYWGKGIATDAIRTANKIAFEKYGIRKLSGGIAEGNVGSIKAYTRADWVIEARMRGHHLIKGEAQDRIVVSCFNPKFFPDEKG